MEGLRFWKTAFSAMTHPAANITSSPQEAEPSERTGGQAELSPSRRHKKIILLPCRIPPSWEHVQLWLKARRQYESLQKEMGRTGTDVTEGDPEGPEQSAPSCCPAVNVEHRGNISSVRTQSRKKLNLSLVLSPLMKTVSQSKPTDLSPLSDQTLVGLEHKEKADDAKMSSPESPELPPWQQSHQPSSSEPDRVSRNRPGDSPPEPGSPRLSGSQERVRTDLSPSLFHSGVGDECGTSPQLLHSTPYVRKRRRSKELEPVCSTPISDGKIYSA